MKAYTAKHAVHISSEAIEAIGGQVCLICVYVGVWMGICVCVRVCACVCVKCTGVCVCVYVFMCYVDAKVNCP